jgi:hypothetical protein
VHARGAGVGIAVVLLLAACGDGDSDGDEATATSEGAPPSTTGAATDDPLPVLRPASGDVGVRALVAGVVAVPSGFLAIGERLPDAAGPGDLETTTALWRSPDGRSWTMTDADPSVWAGLTADRVAQGGAGIAVLAGGDDGRAVVTSADGEAWTVTPIRPDTVGVAADTFPGAYPVNDVAVTGRGFLALGQLVSPDGQAQPLLLTSSDGVAWQRATGPAVAPGRPLPEYFAGVAEAGEQLLVFTTSSDPAARITVWRSADGVSFDVAGGPELFPGPAEPAVTRVATAGDRLVAAGDDPATGDVAVWVSADGQTWELIDSDALGGPGAQTAAAMTTTDDELLMIGTETPDGGGETSGVVWATADGGSWRRLPPGDDSPRAPTLQVVGAAGRGSDVAVVGSQYPGPVDLATLEMSGWWVDQVQA